MEVLGKTEILGPTFFLWKPQKKKKFNQNNTSLHPIPTWGLITPSKNCTVFAQRSKCSRSWLDLQNFLIPKKWLRYCQGIQKLHFGGRENSQENRWKLQNLTDIYWSLFVAMFLHLVRMRKFKMQTWWSGPFKFIFPCESQRGHPFRAIFCASWIIWWLWFTKTTDFEVKDQMIFVILTSLLLPWKSIDQTLPIGSRESFTWIIPKTILCLVLDFQGIFLFILISPKYIMKT